MWWVGEGLVRMQDHDRGHLIILHHRPHRVRGLLSLLHPPGVVPVRGGSVPLPALLQVYYIDTVGGRGIRECSSITSVNQG